MVKERWYAATSNDMTRFIAGREDIGLGRPGRMTERDLTLAKEHLDQFAAIGFVETFDEDLREFANRFRWKDIQYESELVHPSRPTKVDLSSDVIELIEKHNKQDLELYDYARKLVEGRAIL